MNGKRKAIYISVIGVGLVALVIDRMLAGTAPKSASAATSTARSQPAVSSAAAPPGTLGNLSVTVLPFPDFAQGPPGDGSPRDPFTATTTVLHALAPTPPPGEIGRAHV